VNPLKKLAGQTAVYGLSTIVGRLLNYLLVPLYTYQFADPREYGVITEFYAYLSFLNVVLSYGMETALFNFASKQAEPVRVAGTALWSLVLTSTVFLLVGLQFAQPIAELTRHPDHADYVRWVIWILALDAVSAIPFALLRQQQRPGRFAVLKTLNILVNIAGNVLFIGVAKWAYDHSAGGWGVYLACLYDPGIGIGYVFLANLAASASTLVLLAPEFASVGFRFDIRLWRRMLRYGLPLLIAGLAGMINETLDRVLLKYLLPPGEAMAQLGIYGACYKISILMSIFIQAYRFAAEPFFFSLYRERDSKELYAQTMNWFVIVCSAIFLGVMMNLGWIQYFIGAGYRTGLDVVPILLLANLCLGVFFNLSIWYKLTEQTRFGTYLTLWGAAVTLALNYYWIPRIGYMGSAWATLACYGSMAMLSYLMGRRYFPVQYDLRRLLGYPLVTLLLVVSFGLLEMPGERVELSLRNMVFLGFLIAVWQLERPRKSLRYR
jgi:O-antigen/teichoic acid export membrane protein